MRTGSWKEFALAVGTVAILWVTFAFAQTGSTDDSKRKIKTKTAPVYPDLARRMNVTGKVKIEVVIAPDGHVKATRVIGGHPLLVQPCQDAVKEWRFVSAPEETTQIAECDFHLTE